MRKIGHPNKTRQIHFTIFSMHLELLSSEKDWDEITGDFVIDNAELVKSITEDTECEWIKIINNYYEVIVVSDNGEERVETVQIHTTDNGGVEKLILRPTNPKDGIEGTATLLSYLSCYHHNDSKLIDVIKREYLRPPSNIGLQLKGDQKMCNETDSICRSFQ